MTQQHIEELAQACVRFVEEALSLKLDYPQDTLPVLDHYLRERAAQAEPEVLGLVAPAAGAYFGEVVRRAVPGARWHAPDDDYEHYRIELDPVFLHFNPIAVALEVLARDDVEAAHFAVLDEARPTVEQALESGAQVRKDDYYTFSVRFEALEQVLDVLAGLEGQRTQPRRFGPEVYRAACGETNDNALPS